MSYFSPDALSKGAVRGGGGEVVIAPCWKEMVLFNDKIEILLCVQNK